MTDKQILEKVDEAMKLGRKQAFEEIKAELSAEIDAHKFLSQGFAPSAWDRGYMAAIVDVKKAIDKHTSGKESK